MANPHLCSPNRNPQTQPRCVKCHAVSLFRAVCLSVGPWLPWDRERTQMGHQEKRKVP